MARRRRKREESHSIYRRGDILLVRAGHQVYGGACLARLDSGEVIFVDYAIEGELVEAVVTEARRDYLHAVTARVLEPAPERIEPPCPVFSECGGCQYQHMPYDMQLRAKTAVVREQLVRIGQLPDAPVRDALGADEPWHYRNHVRFSTGSRNGDVGYVPRTGRGLLRIEDCPIADPFVNDLLPQLQGRGAGLHQIQIRHNATTGSWLIQPEIEDVPFETGQKHYVEALGGRQFGVNAASFFQVNTGQAEHLVRLVREALPLHGALGLDAFAGVGTFAALIADRFDVVLAIEESPAATRDAEANLTDVSNVEMVTGKVEDVLPTLDIAPDAVILDPPRAGCMPAVLDSLIRFLPGVIVYVSCNPATLARDLRRLVDGGYDIDWVQPVDMFPQTAHIESVTRLTLDIERARKIAVERALAEAEAREQADESAESPDGAGE